MHQRPARCVCGPDATKGGNITRSGSSFMVSDLTANADGHTAYYVPPGTYTVADLKKMGSLETNTIQRSRFGRKR